ncbi:hypothetical protein [Paenibacillus ginsengarvi]|uniref:Uncharacterized protein n=1 Tax=Paenibacillus ginsengarvi TaxID=400777 RepID=A0A3B0CNC8_9BACL|nr:hypothetical protein [Paenibacillus ginsengarvi]RKN85877.1 hypothetical protein D7M11_05955 [Paenibacillus ginsengarvi]
MSSTTPNLGLHKYNPATDGNLTFNIDTALNTPFDIIDEKIGSEIVAAAAKPITIPQGVSIVHSDRKSRFKDMKITGRTLVNLLGRDGNFENGMNWSKWKVDAVTSAINPVTGINRCNVTLLDTAGNINKYGLTFSAGKYYIALAAMKNYTTATGPRIALAYVNGTVVNSPHVTETQYFQTVYAKAAITETSTNVGIELQMGGASGQSAFVDSVRIYEITQAEYNALNTMTAEQVAAKYPYIDDMKHVNAVYVQNPGRNLVPPFSEWTSVHSNANITDPYKLVITSPDVVWHTSFVQIQVVPNTTYTLSISGNAVYAVGDEVSNITYKNFDASPTPFSFVTKGTSKIVQISVSNGAVVGTFTASNPLLNVGPTSLPFEPQQPSYMYLPDSNLRSNVDGSVTDKIYMDGYGKPRAIRRFREMVLDGSLSWVFDVDFTGYKTVKANIQLDHSPLHRVAIKYDGKVLKNSSAGDAADCIDTTTTNGNIYISIADADSGWGQDYSPTSDEIKAYFNGWRISSNNTASPAPYTGAGNKFWYGLGAIPEGPTWYTSSNDINGVVNNQANGPSRYKLMYQLLQSVDEPISYEGELMLHNGVNQIEMGTGVVVREKANVYYNGIQKAYYINNKDMGASALRNRTDHVLTIFKDTLVDTASWELNRNLGANTLQAYMPRVEKFSSSSAYSVTYIALDTYKFGIAPLTITGVVTPNMKEAVDDAVHVISELRRDVSVLQTINTQKQQPQQIAPALLNEWTNKGNDYPPIGYAKNDNDETEIFGDIAGGATAQGTTIMYLPSKYRPKRTLLFDVSSYNGTTWTTGTLIIGTDGRVFVDRGINSEHLLFRNIKFRAE